MSLRIIASRARSRLYSTSAKMVSTPASTAPTTAGMDPEQFRKAAHEAIEHIISYYQNLPNLPVVSKVKPGYLRPLLPAEPPLKGQPWSTIQADIDRLIVPGLTHWQHPNFMAFFPANATFPGILGDMYSTSFTCAAFNWLCSPAVTELETVVLDWVRMALGLPECFSSQGEGGGVIQGSASEAVLTVMVAARDRYLRQLTEGLEGEEAEEKRDSALGKLVALASSQAHSCSQKAAMVSGVKFKTVGVDEEFRVDVGQLRDKIAELKGKGYHPFFVTVTLGTTSSCAVDPFDELVSVAQENPNIWFHVDAAYAGAALILPEYHHLASRFNHFDSFDMNLHKWLLVPFDASCLFVKKRRSLTDALSITPAYLRNGFSDSGLVTDYRDWQIPLGRRFRSLKIWFVWRTYGVEGLRAHISRTIGIGDRFAEWVRGRSDLFEIVAPPRFALTCFRVLPREGGLREGNELTKKICDEVNADGEIFVTGTMLGEVSAIRVVAGSPSVEESHLRRAFEIFVEKAEKYRA